MNYTVDKVILPDIHFPYQSVKGIKRAIEFVGDTKPRHVIQIGDLFDQLSASRHPHSLNDITPEDEMSRSRASAETMWAKIHRAAPKAKLHQLMGNHDGRIMKRVLETLPEVEHLVRPALKSLYTFAHVSTVYSEWDELILDNVCFQHGFKKFGEHAKWNNLSTVHGHDHKADIKWIPTKDGNLFEMSCGLLGEIDSPAFGYRTQKRIHGWSLGIGVIDSYGPRFVGFK